jgi:preprotein translocase subunit SecD
MKKLLATLTICLAAVVAMAADSAKPAVFQMRLVVETPSADSEQLICQSTNKDTGQVSVEKLEVQKKVLLDQTAVKSAVASTNWHGYSQIDFSLTPDGTARFAEITGQNIGKRLAIVIDGQLITAPTIQSAITGGKGQITGNFTEQEAKDLAAKINKAIAR